MNKPSKYNAERNLMVHSNFSFDYISWEHWSSATVANSLFNGSIFENCIFENIAFNNAKIIVFALIAEIEDYLEQD